jgi:hypothetical protein
VTWAQYGEFVEDGGYDERSHWSDQGWEWLQREGRRTPRHVDQMRHGVLQRRFGVLARVAAGQPAVHVSWHEADAWCRWAGRRLPGEVEWDSGGASGREPGLSLGRRARVDREHLPPVSRLRARPVARLFAGGVRCWPQGPARRVGSRPGRRCAALACAALPRPSATTASSAFAAAPHEGLGKPSLRRPRAPEQSFERPQRSGATFLATASRTAQQETGVDIPISLTVNGKSVTKTVDSRTLLVQYLREQLQLTGTHVGCDTAAVRGLHPCT